MKHNEPIVVFFTGSRAMFANETPLTVHGIGLAFLRWLLGNKDADSLCDFTSLELIPKDTYAHTKCDLLGVKCYFVTNLTSVNTAGKALRAFYQDQGLWLVPENIIIVQDDISVPEYKVSLVQRPLVAGGHRGVGDILRTIASDSPARIKIGPHSKDLVQQINISDYEKTFFQALVQLKIVFKNFKRELDEITEIEDTSAKIQNWLKSKDFSHVVQKLNPTNRIRKALKPLAIPVIDEKSANSILEGVETICQAIEMCHKSYVKLQTLPGEHELIQLVNGTASQPIITAAQAQKLDLNYFGIDFHGPSKTSILTWIESNLTSGAPQDDSLLGTAFEREKITELGVKPLNTANALTGLDAIREYAIMPELKPKSIVAIIPSGRFDGLDILIAQDLKANNLPCEICEVHELKWDSMSKTLTFEDKTVGVVVHFGSTSTLVNHPIWEAVVNSSVKIFPNPTAKLYSRKSALPLFGNTLYHKILGISDKISEKLQKFVAYSELVTPNNVMLIKHMIKAGLKIPIKHVVGGGGRQSFLLETGWPKSMSVLNYAAGEYQGENPAIMQDYAPKFSIPGTSYEFDVRAIVYTTKEGRRVVNCSARIYRLGEQALLATSPVYFLPKQLHNSVALKCTKCGLELTSKYTGTNCPRCKTSL